MQTPCCSVKSQPCPCLHHDIKSNTGIPRYLSQCLHPVPLNSIRIYSIGDLEIILLLLNLQVYLWEGILLEIYMYVNYKNVQNVSFTGMYCIQYFYLLFRTLRFLLPYGFNILAYNIFIARIFIYYIKICISIYIIINIYHTKVFISIYFL